MPNTESYKDLFPRLSEPEVRHYIRQLVEVLNFTHAHGIMHRDSE